MAGLELIIDSILSEAKQKAAKNLEEADKRISEMNTEYAEETEKIIENGEASRAEAVKNFKERKAAERASYERDMLLKTERDVAGEIITAAKNMILDMPKEDYFDFLAQIYKNQNIKEGGELLLFPEDKADMPSDFLERLGGNITLSTDSAPSKGFIVRYGRVELNCTVDAIFREKESELYDIACRKE